MTPSKTPLDPDAMAQLPLVGGAIVKRPITDAIADKIATLIASGILQVGDALPSERELSATLGVSRDAVRGGIRTLAAQGILEISQGARTRVVRADVGSVKIGFSTARAIDAYDLDAVHGARLLVEREILCDAALRIDARRIVVLEALLAAQKSAIDDPVRFLISDREFHVTIYQASSNRLLADLGADLYAYMMEYRREAVARPGAIATSYADHVAIVDALKARDPEAAAAAFAAHTGRIYATTHLLMKGDEAPGD